MDRERAFRDILEQYRHRVYSFSYYQLGGREEAEDATQEVFIRLWENWTEAAPLNSPGAWLIRVARNHCYDLLRKKKHQREAIVEGVEDEALSVAWTDESHPRAVMEEAQRRHQLESAVRSLEEPHRSYVILRDIEGWSYAEIAESMEISLDQVKVNIYRARKKLRDKFQEQEDFHGA